MGKLVTKTITGMFNGISQQSSTMRLDTQCEMQENAIGSIVDGLYRRPNSTHVVTLPESVPEDAFMHEVDRDGIEQYNVFITGDSSNPILVYHIDGTPCTVRYGQLSDSLVFTADASVKAYLSTTVELKKAFKAITIADYTLITNRDVVAAMLATLKAGTIVDTVQTFLDLPDAWPDVEAYSAAKVYTKGNLVKGGDRKVYYFISSTDASGKALTDTLSWRIEYTYCSDGEVYEVAGDPTNEFDNYYVKFTDGVWGETVAPGHPYILDAATLPHRLVRTAVDEFTFAPCLWEDRTVGNSVSCPVPSFIGKKISNLTFFKNRLGFIASDTFFLSRAGRYFELFGETAMDLLDDDPIDVLASSTHVVNLTSCIPFNKSLLLNSTEGQFSFGSSGTVLTPSTASLTPTTKYATDKDSEPVGAGPNVYFVNPREKNVSIMEYLIQEDSLTEDAADITAHCPRYIPYGTIKMLSCISLDTIVVHTSGDPSALYVYKYYWSGNEKPQSAWCRWTFNGEIKGISLIGSSVYILIKRNGRLHYERIMMEFLTTADFEFRVHLDRQVCLKGTYSSSTDDTTWTLPYMPDPSDEVVVITPTSGMEVLGVTATGNILTCNGDKSAVFCAIGTRYVTRYRLSEWYVKDNNHISVIDGVLKVRTLTLAYKDTGFFAVEITPENRETLSHKFTGVKIGTSIIGKATLLTGEKKFTVLAKSKNTTIDITSSSHLPFQIVSGAFEGLYVIRSERV